MIKDKSKKIKDDKESLLSDKNEELESF